MPAPPPFPLLFEVEVLVLELDVDKLRLGFIGGAASGTTVVFAKIISVVVASEFAVFEGAVAEEEVDDVDVVVVDVDVVVVAVDGGTALKLYFAYVATLASPP